MIEFGRSRYCLYWGGKARVTMAVCGALDPCGVGLNSEDLFIDKRRIVQVYLGEFVLFGPIILIVHPFGFVTALG